MQHFEIGYAYVDGKISTVLIAAMIESAGRTFFRFYHIPEEIIQTSDDEPVKLKAINETYEARGFTSQCYIDIRWHKIDIAFDKRPEVQSTGVYVFDMRYQYFTSSNFNTILIQFLPHGWSKLNPDGTPMKCFYFYREIHLIPMISNGKYLIVESEYVKNYLTYTNGNVVNGMINLNYVSHVIVKECPYRETSISTLELYNSFSNLAWIIRLELEQE
ncbi:unnamed protein product [Dracunculus medinensis]|uniref:Uncharacterized protein n=1 Tax=Dracunculus medinensis TaxID=318479 RepID=A0A0N4UA25_DRAME|nr:unnamed protein product [Dracunculus medinensis]